MMNLRPCPHLDLYYNSIFEGASPAVLWAIGSYRRVSLWTGPVSYAVERGHVICVRLLLEAGACPDPIIPGGLKIESPLNCAARNSINALVLKTFLDFGADVDASGVDGKTPLIHVSRTVNASFATLLLEYGADINAADITSQTPLTGAVIYNDHNILHLLFDRWSEYSSCPRLRGPHLLETAAVFADLEILVATDHFRLKYDKDCVFAHCANRVRDRYDFDDQILATFQDLVTVIAVAPPSTPLNVPSKNTFACIRCAERKVKCNSLWTRVVEEFHDPGDAFEECTNDLSGSDESDDGFACVLNKQSKSNNRSHHPPSKRIHQLWQIFIENVDPLTKVMHVPTLQQAIQKAMSNSRTIPRSFEALLPPRFMGTISLVVLQALVLHLLSVRDTYEPRAVWSLKGVAVRIAQGIGMGLERDGVFLGLSPFETEMRRRIWWLLQTHDYRISKLCGLHKFRDLDIGSQSTKRLTNANDDQLYSGMPSLLTESETLTDITFVSLKYELFNFVAARISKFRQQGKNSNHWDRDLASGGNKLEIDKTLKEYEGLIEKKYLRYCDPSQPLHLMTMLMARSTMNNIRFLTHHPQRWASIKQTPLPERQWVWELRQEESAKAKRQAQVAKSNHQARTSHQPNLAQTDGGAIDDDPLWASNGFDDNQVGSLNYVMDMDLDFMPAPDGSTGGNASQTISWEQWDTWLAESHAMLPSSSTPDLGVGS
ncbi:hypothetical protein B7494_g41 [Chlorociboria aeruginascens]|nr:hypothetical protein B7494_g41 [Chlorociboria aeruginascens]